MNWWKLATGHLYTEQELMSMDIDELDMMAFGIKQGPNVLPWNKITVIYKEDGEQVQNEVRNSGLTPRQWASKVNLSQPVDVTLRNGRFELEDGHHRWFAAKALNKTLNVSLTIMDKPIQAILKNQGNG